MIERLRHTRPTQRSIPSISLLLAVAAIGEINLFS
jgi:hypothetical protein